MVERELYEFIEDADTDTGHVEYKNANEGKELRVRVCCMHLYYFQLRFYFCHMEWLLCITGRCIGSVGMPCHQWFSSLGRL